MVGREKPSPFGARGIELGKEKKMSIFPTKILLATDASKEADLAAQIAADIAQSCI